MFVSVHKDRPLNPEDGEGYGLVVTSCEHSNVLNRILHTVVQRLPQYNLNISHKHRI